MKNFKRLSLSVLTLILFLNPSVIYAQDADESGAGNQLQNMYDSYSKFDYGDSMNWSDCFGWDLGPGMDMCPGGTFYPPYPTPTVEYSYFDVVAMVEVVHDPWRSFLYKESFFDFEDKAETAFADDLGIKPGLGGGYGKRQGNSKEFQAQQKMETHVWAVSDWWRFKTSDTADACRSLTCKNKDLTGCFLSLKSVVSSLSGGMKSMTDTINNAKLTVSGKGQMIVNEDAGTISYEDGSVYEEEVIYGKQGQYIGTEYVMTRPPGNYGYGNIGNMAGAAMDTDLANSIVPGAGDAIADVANTIKNSEVFKAGTEAYDNVMGNVQQVQDDMQSAWENSEIKQTFDSSVESVKNSFNKDPATDSQIANGVIEKPSSGNYSIPEETKTHQNIQTERGAYTGSGEGMSLSEHTSNISANAMGSNSAAKQAASNDILSKVPGAGGNLGSAPLEQAMGVIDRIQYFNIIEQGIQMIATFSPIRIHPVYMSERHEDAAAEGGFFMSRIYSKLAEYGAGMIAPLFCMSNMLGMAPGAVGDMVGFDIDPGTFGVPFVQEFLDGRCVGSWGPLEPRVNLLGVGDEMVAAGLASARGLDIAQNITGDMYNKTINNTPINELMFNLDWPHRSSCYGFRGSNGGLSRAWTTPVPGGLDNIVSGAMEGDGAGIAQTVGKNTAGNVVKQGGYVFTYWRKRKCRYLLLCNKWRGDTGL